MWSALLLLLSGTILWFPEVVPRGLGGVRQAAVLVHAVTAVVTVAAFIIHLYMGLFVVPGGLHAIVHGDVSERWVRDHHQLWLETLAKDTDRDRKP